MTAPVIFISYSHDSEAHRKKVLGLSERLRADGIETRLDQYLNGSPPEGWPRWMLNQLDAADFVLVVCTQTYYRRFRGQEAPGKGKGVDWEGALITQEIYDSRSTTLKFVPVLFSADAEAFIPEPLRPGNHYTLTSETEYQALYDTLLGQAGVEPGLIGPLKPKARQKAAPMTFGSEPAASEAAASESAALIPAPLQPPDMSAQAVKLLAVSASPRDRDILGVDVEIREIKQAVRAGTFRDQLQIIAETAVLADEFAACVRNHAPQILHFSGYHSDAGGILLMDEDNLSKPIPKEALLHVLGRQPGLRLVVLNTCYSLPAAEALARKIDFAIGVEDLIDDAASIKFAKTLFGAIADGHSVPDAYDQAVTHMIGVWPHQNIPQLRTNKRLDATRAVLVGKPSSEAAGLQVAAPVSKLESPALQTWRRKLEYLQQAEAVSSDPAQKFALAEQIKEAQAKIAELGGSFG